MMGYTLLPLDRGRADELAVSCQSVWWDEILRLGMRYGWQPAGTVFYGPPEALPSASADVLTQATFVVDSVGWQAEHALLPKVETYLGNELQTVTDADAGALASALDWAVADYDQWNPAYLSDNTDLNSLRLLAIDVMNLAAAGGFQIS